jgi:hypothetical protein
MSSDEQYTAKGAALVGFQTDATDGPIDVGAELTGNKIGAVVHCDNGPGLIADSNTMGVSGTGGLRGVYGRGQNRFNDPEVTTGTLGEGYEGAFGVTGLSFLSQLRGALGDGAGVVGASNVDSERDPNNQAKRLGAGVVGLSLKALPTLADTPEPLSLPDLKERPDGNGTGVWGVSSGGIGVHGESGSGTGVKGESRDGTGVHGHSDFSHGVHGESPDGTGVHGVTTHGTGVHGETTSGFLSGSAGIGVHGSGSSFGTGVRGDGVHGPGVQGVSETGHGVHGFSLVNDGIFGESRDGRGGLFVSQKIAQLRLVPADSEFGQATLPAGKTGDLYARSIPDTPAPKNKAELYFCLGKATNGKSLWVPLTFGQAVFGA